LLAEIYLATVYVNQRKREIKKKTWVPNRGSSKNLVGAWPAQALLRTATGLHILYKTLHYNDYGLRKGTESMKVTRIL